ENESMSRRPTVCSVIFVLLADVVAASRAVTATSARSKKIAILAELLKQAAPDEIALVVGYLVGAPPQGRVGIGWSTVRTTGDLSPALESTLTIADVNATIDRVE